MSFHYNFFYSIQEYDFNISVSSRVRRGGGRVKPLLQERPLLVFQCGAGSCFRASLRRLCLGGVGRRGGVGSVPLAARGRGAFGLPCPGLRGISLVAPSYLLMLHQYLFCSVV